MSEPKTGTWNNDPRFVDLAITTVAEIIRDSATALISGDAKGVARRIVAKFTDVHGFAIAPSTEVQLPAEVRAWARRCIVMARAEPTLPVESVMHQASLADRMIDYAAADAYALKAAEAEQLRSEADQAWSVLKGVAAPARKPWELLREVFAAKRTIQSEARMRDALRDLVQKQEG